MAENAGVGGGGGEGQLSLEHCRIIINPRRYKTLVNFPVKRVEQLNPVKSEYSVVCP